ncbi:single-stranded DNA-binding protein [Coprothermobacter platensis]|uniref:single-stranded DNA-binding protein n=1 Tax=Coprothermobacter platensis TaxID=108819 RepID=UPI0003677D1F|nr:single-stranded DNA-binding protein [Coprothermobacter platensis]
MLNKVLLIGRLTADPVIKALPSGKRVANFTLAIDNPGKDQSGAPLPADFIDCVAFGDNLVRLLDLYVKKGRLIFVEGRLRIRSYTDRSGIRRKAAEVVLSSIQFLDSKRDASQSAAATSGSGSSMRPDDIDTMDILDEVESKLKETESSSDFDDDNFDVPF